MSLFEELEKQLRKEIERRTPSAAPQQSVPPRANPTQLASQKRREEKRLAEAAQARVREEQLHATAIMQKQRKEEASRQKREEALRQLATAQQQRFSTASIREQLKKPEQLRELVILREILDKPLALRGARRK